MDKPKNCKLCNNNFKGHFNKFYCSVECKKIAKKNVNNKYYSKIKKIKIDEFEKNNIDEWVPIKGYEGDYMINKKGLIKSKLRQGGGNIILKQAINKYGYKTIKLRKKNEGVKTFCIHRLLGLHFLKNPQNHPVIDHKDRNRLNNDLNNLRWATFQENCINNKRVENSGYVSFTKEYNKQYKKYYYGYRAHVNKKNKRFKSLVKACCWVFENNKFLMAHLQRKFILKNPGL